MSASTPGAGDLTEYADRSQAPAGDHPKDVHMVVGKMSELHVPGRGAFDVILDVHHEAIGFDLVEMDRRIVGTLGLDVLQSGRVAVDVEPASVLGDVRDGFRIRDDRQGHETLQHDASAP
jgi:hypothetical protein